MATLRQLRLRLVLTRREEILRENLLLRRREVQIYSPQTAGARDELDRELEAMREDTLERIERSLAQIENGTYGFCVNPKCQKPIEEKRLLAVPFARLCLACDLQAEFEYVRQQVRARRRSEGPLFD